MVAHPEKELRFTRAQQGRNFFILGSVLASTAVTFFATSATVWFGGEPPFGIAWSLIPLAFCLLAFWLATHCTRKAFLILSPVGIEFFPFFSPIKNFQLWNWQTLASAEMSDEKLTLHFNQERTAGAVISLRPMNEKSRSLLKSAIEGRMAERAN